jgi:RNA polymerase sigma factor (sigma-70 family)
MPVDTEHDLLVAAGNGDRDARQAIVDRYLALISAAARRYQGVGAVDRQELVQEGVVGVLRAVDRFDSERATPFWAYASWWVRQAMQQLVAELGHPTVMSDRALRQLASVRRAQHDHGQRFHREASTAELSEATGFSSAHLDELTTVDRTPRPLDEPYDAEDHAGETFGETLSDPRAEDDFDAAVSRIAGERVRSLPASLAEREQTVLAARYGLDGRARTLREIGCELSLSAERVRQIEQCALDKLREAAVGPAR